MKECVCVLVPWCISIMPQARALSSLPSRFAKTRSLPLPPLRRIQSPQALESKRQEMGALGDVAQRLSATLAALEAQVASLERDSAAMCEQLGVLPDGPPRSPLRQPR